MSKNTIVWAINPNEKNQTTIINSALFLQKMAKVFDAKIIPTYVLSPSTLFLPTDYFMPPNLSDFKDSSKKSVQKVLKKLRMKSLEPVKVIIDENFSLRENAKSLIDYAKKQKAFFIFAPTHGRSGVPRFWLGSFVENLLLYSDVPVFTFNPTTKINLSITSVLFPTDLSAASRTTFKAFLGLAKKLGAKVTLYHHLRNFNEIIVSPEGLTAESWEFYKEELENIRIKKTEDLKSWQLEATKALVECNYVIAEGRKSVVESILDVVKKNKIKLLALATSSGPVESLFAGGTARQLVRYSLAPVWVVHKEVK